LANQKLLAKHGYICIGKSEYNLQMHDGNDGVKVYFKDLRH
uniref:GNAT family N-acetyltransferase n=1 Tax=Angiostrongylus cantonensis TaxID=6313 RepID=A0A0K0D1C8_ANGCA